MNTNTTHFLSLEKKLKLKFKDQDLLITAFTHRSFLNENKGKNLISNERLEFLGDTILSFIISEYLYKTFPNFSEGDLTAVRSATVNTKSLSLVSQKLHLGNYLLLSKGEEDSGGRTNTSLLANTFEALVGAVYLEKGIGAARKLLEEHLIPWVEIIIKEQSYKDYKSKLQELVQEKLKISPTYKLIDAIGPDHNKEFEIAVLIENKEIGKGKGKSKQEGEQQAAKQALANWLDF